MIEISVLGAPRSIRGPDEIVIGRDGVRVESDGRRGILLPQVAPDAGWNAATLVAKTCEKAGLAEDAWQRADVQLSAFSAQVFSDHTHPALRRN